MPEKSAAAMLVSALRPNIWGIGIQPNHRHPLHKRKNEIAKIILKRTKVGGCACLKKSSYFFGQD